MISSLRGELFEIFARYYEEHGIPGLCGWIDTLFLFESTDQYGSQWTQKTISKRLKELFPSGKYPTSVPSVNRAIKINEKYGTIIKKGTHKSGYTYEPASGSEMVTNFFEIFIKKSNICINELEDLLTKCQNKDHTLKKITEEQILGYKAYVQLLEHALSFFKEKLYD